MKLLVFSDSHGVISTMEQAILLEQPDHILHLGDCVRDARKIEARFDIPLTLVPGNCDGPAASPEILMPVFAGKRIYMTHGHLYGVKMTYTRAVYAALEAEADFLLFGHTHHPECFQKQGLWILNPGSCGYGKSYGVIRLSDDKISCCLKHIN